jgi:ATP synthase F1 gamma subunit
MSAVRDLQEELEQTETAQFVTTMLRDISATRLQSIRTIFEANRAYYTELHTLMAMVQSYAQRVGIELDQTQFGTGKAFVAVTSNKRFYGQLNQLVIKEFVRNLQVHPSAAGFVIGQTGVQIIERMRVARPVTSFVFPSDTPTHEEMASVITALHPYNEVMICHPTFINSFRQEPVVTDITHEPKPVERDLPPVEYICEPDITALLEFFRTQIRYVLFDRVLLETRVALTGARLMKMQRARERAKELVKQQRQEIHKVVSTAESMRLLETFTGFRSDRTI